MVLEFESTLKRYHDENYHSHYIPIPKKWAEKAQASFGKRLVCQINGDALLHCAIVYSKSLGHLITIGKQTKKDIGIEADEVIHLQLAKDESKYQMHVCEEFLEVLETDSEGFGLFEQLTPGRQRGLIHHVNKAKQSDTRINRAIKIMENLKLGYKDPKDLIR